MNDEKPSVADNPREVMLHNALILGCVILVMLGLYFWALFLPWMMRVSGPYLTIAAEAVSRLSSATGHFVMAVGNAHPYLVAFMLLGFSSYAAWANLSCLNINKTHARVLRILSVSGGVAKVGFLLMLPVCLYLMASPDPWFVLPIATPFAVFIGNFACSRPQES